MIPKLLTRLRPYSCKKLRVFLAQPFLTLWGYSAEFAILFQEVGLGWFQYREWTSLLLRRAWNKLGNSTRCGYNDSVLTLCVNLCAYLPPQYTISVITLVFGHSCSVAGASSVSDIVCYIDCRLSGIGNFWRNPMHVRTHCQKPNPAKP